VRAAGLLAGAVLTVLVAALVMHALAGGSADAVAPQPSNLPAQWQRPNVSPAGLEQRSGIRITQVSVTGGGGLLDLRFRVTDPDLAAAIHDDDHPPAIIDESTGLVVDDLLMGHSHKGQLKPAVTYYLIFESPGNLVHRGSKVTVLLGNAQLQHVVVT
jgi:hypothetical protein